MGGFFEPQQSPTQVVSPIPKELGPFANELVQAISNLFMQPGGGVTPLEEGTIRGIFQQAEPARHLLDQTVRGSYLPGQDSGNPFISALMQGLESQGDVARRQLAGSAQRSGMLSSRDYLRQAGDLESSLAQKRGEVLANLWESERGRQYGAVPLLGSMGQFLLGAAGIPREVATDQMRFPFNLGVGLLGSSRGSVIPGQSSPSPFASILSAASTFLPLVL